MSYKPSLKTNSRIEVADILRGIAIGGIVLIHFIEQLNFYKFPEASCEFMASLNKTVWDSLFFMLASKMYAIFSMLFGLSFFIQHDNQAQLGKDFRSRFVWRMVLLFCWGLFDLLFYNGDILTVYAACGLLVIPFIRANNKVLIAAIIFFALQPIEIFYIVKGLIDPATQSLNLGSSELFKAIIPAQEGGSIFDVALADLRYGFLVNFTWAIEHGRMTQTIFLFLLGIYLGRKRLFYDEGNNIEVWKKILVVSLCAFVVLYPLYDAFHDTVKAISKADRTCVQKSLDVMLNMWKNLSMMFCYVSGVVLLYYRTSARNFLSKIAPYGKMSLTNYLSQSIIGGFVFYNWGLGMFRYSGHASSLLLGVVCVALQYMFCRWWLKRHSHGPFEMLWRKATWIGAKK
ncbi:MAG: DUF418 domain-containing protein [Alistipes sp.]|nr:DUF418 domain-containing protein [Alistipes sp.]